MSLVDGTWRNDFGKPVYPGTPAPHALQDGLGLDFDADGTLYAWPGLYYPYVDDNGESIPVIDPAKYPITAWSLGYWRYKKEWTQDTRLFMTPYSGAGNESGGALVDGVAHTFADSQTALAVHRYDLRNGVKLPDLPLVLPSDPTMPGRVFHNSKVAIIGRKIYVLGYRWDGADASAPLFFVYDLDTQRATELAKPDVATMPPDRETRLAVSHGKVVWIRTSGPDGEIDGIWIYDPATDAWSVDRQVPIYGAFLCNSLVSLPDGRVGFSGGVFNRQQTHFWFYEAA